MRRIRTSAMVSSTAKYSRHTSTNTPNRSRTRQCHRSPWILSNGTYSYKHAVIQNLVNDTLLRNVRSEIREHIHFTPKETDIYKIHQSGDLANLDGLDESALKRLPSLLTLRDSLYSSAFRKYLSSITGSGPLSGVKTDMAVVRCVNRGRKNCTDHAAECLHTRVPLALPRRRHWEPSRELDLVPA
jgi:Rps23 Pro-64 3,4-dihydroxylase Tpa1-like proline 4-hydroxylase